MSVSLHSVAIFVTDIDRAHAFYVELLDLLVAAANAPALSSAAELPAHIALPALVGDPWHLLEKRAEALGKSRQR